MADLKTLVERELHRAGEPSFSLADLGRRRRRSERNRRVGTAVVALAVVGAAIGGLVEAFGRSTGQVGESPRPSCTAFERACGWIAFNDGTGIWAVNPEKSYPGTFSPRDHPDDAVRLAGPAAGDPIAWSADGSRLLVRRPSSAFVGQPQALFVLEEDGSETRVADSDTGFYGASISPDGTQVVYASGQGRSLDALRLEVATVDGGSEPVVLTHVGSSDLSVGRPAFSPDGEWIAYIEGGYDHSNALWVMKADGSRRRQVAGGEWGHVRDLVWSPDGERLAISCRCQGVEGIAGVYTIRSDGTGLTLVSADDDMPVPQWSPDSSQIALVHADNFGRPTTATLVVVGAEGGDERELAQFELALLDEENPRRLTIAWNPAG